MIEDVFQIGCGLLSLVLITLLSITAFVVTGWALGVGLRMAGA